MKEIFKTTGTIDIDGETITTIINEWLEKKYGYKPTELKWSKRGPKSVAVVAFFEIDKPFTPKKAYKRSPHKWEGLYWSVGEVIDKYRKKRKKFILFTDLLGELLQMNDGVGHKMFVINGETLPMAVLRHRLAPSQLTRQALNQPNLSGVKNDKRNKGLKFS